MPSETATPTRQQHLQALLLALVCSVLFLRDALLPGRALVPHPPELFDVQMAEAQARGTFDPADTFRGNVGMQDKYLQSLCWDRVLQDRLRSGEIPRWTNDIGGGAPFVPQMAQPYEPINLLLLLLPSAQWYSWWFLVHQVLFGWFAYVFLRRLGCGHAAALVSLVAAVLGLWTQCKLHHNVILTAALSLWPMLSSVLALVAEGAAGAARRRWLSWLALWTGLSWCSGFVVVSLQVTYLTVGFAVLLAAKAPRGERLRRLVPVGLGLGLGAVLSCANMVPVLLASATSARSGTFDAERLRALGLEWDDALTLCWPDLLCWAQDRFYFAAAHPADFVTRTPWSQLVLISEPLRPDGSGSLHNWVEASFSIGLAPLGCALLALFDRERHVVAVFWAVIALCAFGIATTDQPFFALARLVPGLTSADLRRLVFTAAMALVVLSGLGADALCRGVRRWPMFALFGAAAAMSIVALAWLWPIDGDYAFVRATAQLYVADTDHPLVRQIGGSVDAAVQLTQASMMPGEAAENAVHLATTAWRTLLVALLAVAALLLRPRFGVPVLAALGVCELLHAGLGAVQTVPATHITTPPAVLAPVLAAGHEPVRPRLQRLVAANAPVITALPGNMPGFLGVEDGGAYNPLPPARYEEFFTAIEPRREGRTGVAYGGAGVGSFRDPASLTHPLCDLYGLRFVLTREPVPTSATLIDRTPAGTGGFRLLERTTTLPRATFVRQVDVLPDHDQRLAALSRSDRDVVDRVVLEDPKAPMPSAADATPPAEVRITEHRDERVVISVRTQQDGYLRLADPYDAGWCARLDGEEVPIFVADHYLRAVFVPPGEHQVVFTYDGARVVWPARVSLIALLAIMALAFAGRRRTA